MVVLLLATCGVLRVVDNIRESAQAVEATAEAVEGAIDAILVLDSVGFDTLNWTLWGFDTLNVDVDTVREQGIRLGGAVGASFKAVLDSAAGR